MGRSYSHIQENYWTYHWGSHIIFYRIEKDNTVSVVRILHERMDFDRHL
ncbi:MAG: type II toxin-antitoxin system RelE/ParE family toxin [Bacteroidales bacterium]|nr:type II toxin-antitoxin system RelE/ParE family toxin [Bacteroidales bacterium]